MQTGLEFPKSLSEKYRPVSELQRGEPRRRLPDVLVHSEKQRLARCISGRI